MLAACSLLAVSCQGGGMGSRLRPDRRLKGEELQSGDLLEVALVACGDGVSTFQGTSPDEQIVERDRDALLRRFGMDLSDQFRGVGP